jgi:N-ethylmaleimide reductase
MNKLHTAIQVGPHQLAHRVVLAPLTACAPNPAPSPAD